MRSCRGGRPFGLEMPRFLAIPLILAAYTVCCRLSGPVSAAEPGGVEEPRIVSEDFSTNPLGRGWVAVGHHDLFRWDSLAEQLQVTWDSSLSNSYFRLPLGTLLTRRDDFSLSVDLTLSSIAAGIGEGRPGTFQLAFGFHNRVEADRPGFFRGAGDRSPNLVEFNFFPDTGFGPTVWPVVVSTNGRFSFSGSGDFSLFELPLDTVMRIQLRYEANQRMISASITTNGVLAGPIADSILTEGFTDFEVDAVSFSSYSDAGQGPFMPGSIRAMGMVDNIVLRLPPPAIRFERGGLVEGRWEQTLLSRKGWIYVLEGTVDLEHWREVSERVEGTGGELKIREFTATPVPVRFLRVKAELRR